ncbi:reverse transcriptase [Senna tora]|uniref:Reverse transcriptase n=1 Tax=Senna tora TaxID=362788 RepID=A0A834W9H2_9FABA|nr:reverse transcriptase [Senna tora]
MFGSFLKGGMKWALLKWRCTSSPVCPICGVEEETIEHVLLFRWVKIAWFRSPLTLKFREEIITSFNDWCQKVPVEFDGWDDFSKSLFAIMCWTIWKARCQFVFEGIEAKEHDLGDCQGLDVRDAGWNARGRGQYKFNVDGSFILDPVQAGIGVIWRYSRGLVLDDGCVQVQASLVMTEALALKKACKRAADWLAKMAVRRMCPIGLKTAIVSYCLSPGGHCGSSFSSTAVNLVPAEVESSSDPNPPSKKEPEKSRVWAWIENPESFLFDLDFVDNGVRQREKLMIGEDGKFFRELVTRIGDEGEIGVDLSEDDAIGIDASALCKNFKRR